MNGLVVKTTGNIHSVLIEGEGVYECPIKGHFRLRGIRTTNPVAVGDRVTVERLSDGTRWITGIEERKNYIIRRSTNLSKEAHVLASNLDQAALLLTLNHPVTSLTFVDRFLATAEAYRVPVLLVFNKVDLLTKEEQGTLSNVRAMYEHLGYQTEALCANTREGGDRLRPLLRNKVTLLSGNSGVGKSTLLNTLFGRELTRTGQLSDAHDKGMHTTTFSEMYPLEGGWIIDTPGIKGFGAVDMEKTEVSHYFREIFRVGQGCRYSDCLHTDGGCGCAVTEAVVRGEIALSRYESYLSLLGDINESKYR